MISADSKLVVNDLRLLISSSNRIVAFTGAGISAESGIPTYRDTSGVWTKYDSDKYASIEYFRIDPGYFWSFFRDVRLLSVKNARPNQAHEALVRLEKQGKLISVITQNIDGLHKLAGSENIRELHGNTTRFYCIECGNRYGFNDIELKLIREHIPHCDRCKGVLRPDVVLFGEMLPDGVFEQSLEEAVSADLLLVVGSSLVVYPAADIPYRSKLNGAKLVILNIDATPFDGIADLVVHAPAGEVLYRVVA